MLNTGTQVKPEVKIDKAFTEAAEAARVGKVAGSNLAIVADDNDRVAASGSPSTDIPPEILAIAPEGIELLSRLINVTPKPLKDNEDAVILGMSAPGTEKYGPPTFRIDVGVVHRFSSEDERHGLIQEGRRGGHLDYGVCIPAGKNSGWVAVASSRTYTDDDDTVVEVGEGKIRLLNRRSLEVKREADFPDLKYLRNVNDSHGMILPRSIAAKVVDFLNQEGEFKPASSEA